jgi:hypothetical protein
MLLRLFIFGGLAAVSQAWALSTAANPGVAYARLVFEKSNASLSEQQTVALDHAAAEMEARCGSDWQSRSWLNIEYSVAPGSLPRQDYQLIGERAEHIRNYMQRYKLKMTRVSIDISEGAYDNTAQTGLDHFASVTMMCSL